MQTVNERIVACARGWLGTRFHHQGRLKRTAGHLGGVDCLGLVVGVARELGLADPSGALLSARDRTDYGHLPDGAVLYAGLNNALAEVSRDSMQPGDVALITLDGNPQHIGILTDWPLPHSGTSLGLIHAYAQARRVVEHALDALWQARIVNVFRFIPDNR